MYKNKILAHFVVFLLFCLMIGCAHGKKVQPDKTANEKPQLEVTEVDNAEAVNIEADDTEADDEVDVAEVDDDDDFFDDDEDEFEIEAFENEGKVVADPLYYFNISMFHFNDKLYFWCLKPAANAYKAVTPEFFRIGLKNFFSNLSTPVRFASCLLQGKIKGAGSEVGRLVINTTLGFGGLIDTAKHSFKLNEADEDLGQVLGKYRIGNGFYLYLPFLGPTTLRDSIGSAGEYFLDPMFYVENQYLGYGLSGFSKLNSVSFMIGDYEAVKAASLDPYTMIRDFYIVQRQKKIKE